MGRPQQGKGARTPVFLAYMPSGRTNEAPQWRYHGMPNSPLHGPPSRYHTSDHAGNGHRMNGPPAHKGAPIGFDAAADSNRLVMRAAGTTTPLQQRGNGAAPSRRHGGHMGMGGERVGRRGRTRSHGRREHRHGQRRGLDFMKQKEIKSSYKKE